VLEAIERHSNEYSRTLFHRQSACIFNPAVHALLLLLLLPPPPPPRAACNTNPQGREALPQPRLLLLLCYWFPVV
jgi:hypothetical protein